jgi:hypothetical protein
MVDLQVFLLLISGPILVMVDLKLFPLFPP